MEITDEKAILRIIENERIVSKMEMLVEHLADEVNDPCTVHCLPPGDSLKFGVNDDHFIISEIIGTYVRYLELKKQ